MSSVFIRGILVLIVLGLVVMGHVAPAPVHPVWAQGAPDSAPAQPAPKPKVGEGSDVEGAGYSLFDTPSIKGFDANKVQSAPVCDPGRRPKVTKVEPDEVKPGDKVVIKGENLGPKECLHTVTFGSDAAGKFTLVDEGTIEATVPNSKTGMSFVRVTTGGGSAQSKPVLIKK